MLYYGSFLTVYEEKKVKEKIQADIKDAMRSKNKELLTTLRGLIAEIKNIEIDTRSELSDDKVADVIQKEIKKRRDAIKFAKEAGREELVVQNEQEIEMLTKYLGAQLSEEELREVVSGLVSGGADAIGKVMGALNKDYKGRFDGRAASQITKELLG